MNTFDGTVNIISSARALANPTAQRRW